MPGATRRVTFKAVSFPTVRAIVYPCPTHNQYEDSAGRHRICKDKISLILLRLRRVCGRYGTLRDAELAERRGFEPMIRILGPSSDYLLRNDWLSSLIGALLCRLGCGRGAL